MPPFPIMKNNTFISSIILHYNDDVVLPATKKICDYNYNKEYDHNYCQNADYERQVSL